MEGITITITGATGAQTRELMADLLGNTVVTQAKPKLAETGDEGNCTNTTPTRAAEMAPAKRTRSAKPKPETTSPSAPQVEEAEKPVEEAVSKEDFLAKLNGLRATYGDGIIPDLRKILAEYKTETGETVVQSSQVQLQDFPKIMKDFAALEAKKKDSVI